MLIPHILEMDFPKTSTSTWQQIALSAEGVICEAIFVHVRVRFHASVAPDEFHCPPWPEAVGSAAAPVTLACHYVHL